MHKVILHVEENARVGVGLRYIEVLFNELEADNVEVELLTNGEAVTMLAANNNFYENASKIADLAAKGAKFAACSHAMQSFNLTKEKMLPQVIVVPSGPGELTIKQNEGFGYIRV
jgi:hypothetical protein